MEPIPVQVILFKRVSGPAKSQVVLITGSLLSPPVHIARWALRRRFLSVCLGVPRAHYTPLHWYLGYLCTRKAQYAPLRRNMHHGAQGRLCFLRVAHKEHTSVWVICRLSPYVCVCYHSSRQTDEQKVLIFGVEVE